MTGEAPFVDRVGRRYRVRPGPKLRGVTAYRVVGFRLTEAEYQELGEVAAENGSTMATVIREAVNEFIGDYTERRVLERRPRRTFNVPYVPE